MNRRELLKTTGWVVLFSSLPKSIIGAERNKLNIKAVIVGDDLEPIVEAKLLHPDGENFAAKWQIEKKCHASAMHVYANGKLVCQQSIDVDIFPGDTFTITLPREIYEEIKVESNGEPVIYA